MHTQKIIAPSRIKPVLHCFAARSAPLRAFAARENMRIRTKQVLVPVRIVFLYNLIICRHKTLHPYKPFLCFVTAIRTRISCFAPAQCRRRNTTVPHATHRCVLLLRENTNGHNRKHGKSFACDVVHKTCAFFLFCRFGCGGEANLWFAFFVAVGETC